MRLKQVEEVKKKIRVSSKDVAREAGVSQATVSYVLNNVEHVKIRPETRQAVWDAVKKLNYSPSHIARGMKLKRSMSVGVITDRSVTNYNFMKTLQGIKEGLARFNYTITLLFNTQEETFHSEIISYYNSNRLDGFIFAFAAVEDYIRNDLNLKGVPYLIIDSHVSGLSGGGCEVGTDHLIHIPGLAALFKERGISRMAYVGPLLRHREDPKPRAYKEAVKINHLVDCGSYLCSFDDDEIRKMVHDLLMSPKRPQGILAGNPRFGFHTLRVAAELGLRIPGDLLAASLGTSAFHDFCYPPMTAVELPLFDMGYTGAEMLVDIMQDKDVDRIRILPSEIVLRGSL
jgi:DNA-binding LacI/PurR family transcriptional regulator